MLYKTILDLAVAIDVIRSDTGLAAVKKFSKNNPAGSKLQIALTIHDAGAFAAEFQSDRSEELTCLCHNFFADVLASGKENIIEMLIEQTGVFFAAAGDNGDKFWFKAVLNKSLDQCRRGW